MDVKEAYHQQKYKILCDETVNQFFPPPGRERLKQLGFKIEIKYPKLDYSDSKFSEPKKEEDWPSLLPRFHTLSVKLWITSSFLSISSWN